ncbi:MAG: hypothetical protein AB7P42_14195 [Gammaproteobacteria bacterium]
MILTITVRSPRALRAVALALLAASLAACGPAGGSYYPLAAGRWWHYAVQSVVLDEPRQSRFLLQNAGLARGLDGQVHLQISQTRSADFLRADGQGVIRIASQHPGMPGPRPDEPPRVLLPRTLAPGTAWQVRSSLALAESRTFEPRDRIIPRRLPVVVTKTIAARDATVEVAAGRFDHCLLVEGVGEASVPADRGNTSATIKVSVREWYAPGVGLVRLEREETTASTFFKPGRQRWELLDHGD